MPTSHQGAARPDVKNSAVLDPARFAKKIAGRNEITIDAAMMVQSIGARCILEGPSSRTATAAAIYAIRLEATRTK
jgi:hypothetical protein